MSLGDNGDTKIFGSYVANAGKEYTCDTCSKVIYKGERYVRLNYKVKDEFKCEHHHYVCSSL